MIPECMAGMGCLLFTYTSYGVPKGNVDESNKAPAEAKVIGLGENAG